MSRSHDEAELERLHRERYASVLPADRRAALALAQRFQAALREVRGEAGFSDKGEARTVAEAAPRTAERLPPGTEEPRHHTFRWATLVLTARGRLVSIRVGRRTRDEAVASLTTMAQGAIDLRRKLAAS